MARDDLNDPIGLDDAASRPSPREIPWTGLAVGGCGLIVASLVAFLFVTDNGLGGEPYSVAVLERPAPVPVPRAPAISSETTGTIGSGAKIIGIDQQSDDETQNGVRILRANPNAAPATTTTVLPSGAIILKIPEETHKDAASSPDRKLLEKGRYGMLPRIAADGTRPADAYAGHVPAPGRLARNAPRVAIVIGGMGVSQIASDAAMDKLPAEVTLGFAPVGADLESQVARARAGGHEILLQAPMEGFGGTDAGPSRQLLTSVAASQNVDTLQWLMSRFSGYAGVMNFLGARFLADQAALSPVLRELGGRGLYWFDDGSAPQSLSTSVAGASELPARRADLVLDASAQPDAVEAALKRLETIARAKGSAVGVASALPETVDRIAPFARGLAERGIALVPLSAMMGSRRAGLSQR